MTTDSKRPLVRFLGHGPERSGPPVYLLRLLRWWHRNPPPFDVELVLARPGPLLDEYRTYAPVRVGRLDRRSPERVAERGLAAAGWPAAAATVIDAVTRNRVIGGRRPDITVVNGATAATAQLLRAIQPTEPVVVIAHELATGWFNNIDAEARALLLKADRFLAVSRCVERFLLDQLAADAAQISVLPPTVDVRELSTTDVDRRDGRIVIGGAGMTDWRKAPALWLRVAHEARRLMPALALQFVWFGGESPGSAAFWPLAHEIHHLGLDDVVEFVGEVSDPMKLIASNDLFVSTAREDAYPLVCAESALAGVPIVAFDGGGAAELINDSGGGVVVSYPQVETMAATVVELAQDPTKRATLGQGGRAFALDQLDVSVIAPRVESWIISGSIQ